MLRLELSNCWSKLLFLKLKHIGTSFYIEHLVNNSTMVFHQLYNLLLLPLRALSFLIVRPILYIFYLTTYPLRLLLSAILSLVSFLTSLVHSFEVRSPHSFSRFFLNNSSDNPNLSLFCRAHRHRRWKLPVRRIQHANRAAALARRANATPLSRIMAARARNSGAAARSED